MDAAALLSDLLMRFAADPLLLVPTIILATFILEDLATVTVALLSSRMLIDSPTALTSVVLGTILGDLALYAVARWAGHRPLARRWLGKAALAKALDWMRRNALLMVVLARFTPGLRLPVFAGVGTIGMPFPPFAATVVVTTLIWTPGLWFAATKLDMSAQAITSGLGLTVGLAFGAVMLLAPHAAKLAFSRA